VIRAASLQSFGTGSSNGSVKLEQGVGIGSRWSSWLSH
jgi:hypothetical protein